MVATIRAFIAIELPSDVKKELGGIGQSLALQMPPRLVRWVQPDNMHLTLRFLGDTAVTKLALLAQQLDELATHHPPFHMQLGRLGCFPNPKRPRVIWVGTAGDHQVLVAVKQGLDERLAPLGWAVEDKPFSAHLTIGRVNDGHLPPTMNWDVPVNPLPFTVHEIHLIESRLTPKGPIYTRRHTAVLRSPAQT
ncbi:MAG TPA: RNA 2',3'-cyclic phosphodiesterase [Chloroflexota bacterium]|nr:RNA 2',3'-cyclic phosphodiesterase [Chloroflexota bacterium]